MKCPACDSPVVRRSHFRNRVERDLYRTRSPYRCESCGNRFFVVSYKARRGILIAIVSAFLIALATLLWLMTPPEVKRLANLPKSKESSNLPQSPAPETKPLTLAEMARESRCISEPVNVIGETYKCATPSGLTAYFVVPEPKTSAEALAPGQGPGTRTLPRGDEPPH